MNKTTLTLSLFLASALPAPGLPEEADTKKRMVELPVKEGLADRSKAGVELLLKAALAPPVPALPAAVAWHATFEDARQAAAKSGRPVLLFQLLGKLDDAFC